MDSQVLTYSLIKNKIYNWNSCIQRDNSINLVNNIELYNDTVCIKICYENHIDYLYYKDNKWIRTLFSDISSKVFTGVINSKEVSNVLNYIVNKPNKIIEFKLLTDEYSINELSLMEHNKDKYKIITVNN